MPVGSTSIKLRLQLKIKRQVFFSVLLLLCLFGSSVAAAGPPIAEEAFWTQVHQTQAWLSAPHSAPEWAAEAQAWAEISEISLPDGQAVRVDTSEIVRQLSADAPDVDKLKAYLSSLDGIRAQWAQTECASCKASMLNEILSRPEFTQGNQAADPIQRFFQQLLDALVRWLNSFTSGAGGSARIPPAVFIALISIVLVLILLFIFRDVFTNLAGEAELAGEGAGEEQALTASLANQKARSLSGAGDYRLAIRYLYLSALLLLDERGLLRYNRSLTNREYLRQVRGQPLLESNLRVIVDEFDRVWYGFAPVDQDEYLRYVSHVDAIEAIKP